MPTYNRDLWKAAHERFIGNPSALTDGDLEQLALTDGALAERARAKRAGFVEREDDDLKAAGDEPLSIRDFLQWNRDTYAAVQGTILHRLDQVDKRVTAVELAAKPGGVQFAGTDEERIKTLITDVLTTMWQGTWTPEQTHRRGMTCIHDGSTWICVAPISRGENPSKQADDISKRSWRLMAMRGKDGRGSR